MIGSSTSDYYYVQQMCHLNLFLFAFVGSEDSNDGLIYNFKADNDKLPTAYSVIGYAKSEPTIARGIKCIDEFSAFIFVDRPDSLEYSIIKATFGSTNEIIEWPYSTSNNPFSGDSGYSIHGAFYVSTFLDGDPLQFLFYG